MAKENYVLCKTDNKYFADGWQLYREVELIGGGIGYKHGDYRIDEKYIMQKFDLDSLDLDWIELEKRHEPTFFEKIKNRFGIKYPETDYQRPKTEGLVVVDYGGFMEVAEVTPKNDGGCIWITELNSYMKPKKWACIPNKILVMTQKEIQEKARSCKYFYSTPLCTALICKKKDKELKSVLHGIEWDGKECENCIKYKPQKK